MRSAHPDPRISRSSCTAPTCLPPCFPTSCGTSSTNLRVPGRVIRRGRCGAFADEWLIVAATTRVLGSGRWVSADALKSVGWLPTRHRPSHRRAHCHLPLRRARVAARSSVKGAPGPTTMAGACGREKLSQVVSAATSWNATGLRGGIHFWILSLLSKLGMWTASFTNCRNLSRRRIRPKHFLPRRKPAFRLNTVPSPN
jgi:hypothetical protein